MIVLAIAGFTGPAARAAAATSWWLEAGPAAGGLSLDDDLADYRWETGTLPVWGAQALVGRGGLAGGLCVWRTSTTQGTGLPDGAGAPTVMLTNLAAVGRVRLVSPLGIEMWATGQIGRVHLAWSPEQLVIDPGTGAAPVTITYQALDEWNPGLGVELRRQLGSGTTVALQVERTAFALDTAHRRGDGIDESRDRFVNWSARLQLAWRWSL